MQNKASVLYRVYQCHGPRPGLVPRPREVVLLWGRVENPPLCPGNTRSPAPLLAWFAAERRSNGFSCTSVGRRPMADSLSSCARPRGYPVYRRNWRVTNPPQDAILPHKPSSRRVSRKRLGAHRRWWPRGRGPPETPVIQQKTVETGHANADIPLKDRTF